MHRISVEYYGPNNTEAFEQHYRDVHVPLAAKIPGLRRFTLSYPRGLGTASPQAVAEMWFDDAGALTAALKSPEMASAGADAQTFALQETRMFSGEVIELTI